MKKYFVMFAILFSVDAFAHSVTSLLGTPTPNQSIRNCTDFSGHWVGSCTKDNRAIDLRIHMDACKAITVTHIGKLIIGDQSSMRWSSNNSSLEFNYSASWQDNESKLKITESNLIISDATQSHYSHISNYLFWIENDELRVTETGLMEADCTYHRK